MHNELESDFMLIVTASVLIYLTLQCGSDANIFSLAGQPSCLNFFLAADHDLCPSPINRQV